MTGDCLVSLYDISRKKSLFSENMHGNSYFKDLVEKKLAVLHCAQKFCAQRDSDLSQLETGSLMAHESVFISKD